MLGSVEIGVTALPVTLPMLLGGLFRLHTVEPQTGISGALGCYDKFPKLKTTEVFSLLLLGSTLVLLDQNQGTSRAIGLSEVPGRNVPCPSSSEAASMPFLVTPSPALHPFLWSASNLSLSFTRIPMASFSIPPKIQDKILSQTHKNQFSK